MTTDQSPPTPPTPPTLPFQEFLAKAPALFEQAATDVAHDHKVQVERSGTIYVVSIRPQSPESPQSQLPSHREGTLPDDFFALQGSAESEEPTDVGTHKHDYLADAYEALHEDLHDK